MKNIDEVLKRNIYPDYVPADDLNARILKCAEEDEIMKKKNFKWSVAVASLVGTLVLGSVSAYAAYHLLSPARVAVELTGSSKLEDAFNSESAVKVNKMQKTGGYNITLMGTVTGKDLTTVAEEEKDFEISKNKTYAVVAIEKEDGTPMPDITDKDYKVYCISPLIHGKSFLEMSVGNFHGGVNCFTRGGVQYELLTCDDLEIFSEIGVSIGVVENYGDETAAFTYDEKTGLHCRNKEFAGVNALFELPLDKSKADNKAAEEVFQNIENESKADRKKSDDEPAYYMDKGGLPIGKDSGEEMAADLPKNIKYFTDIYSQMLTEEQIEKLMSYGTIVDEQKFNEKDGRFHVAISNEYMESEGDESAEVYEEGVPQFYFTGASSDSMIAEYLIKENGVLTEKVVRYEKDQIDKMYQAFH